MKKKLIAFFAAAMLCVTLAGCEKDNSGKSPSERTSELTSTLSEAAADAGTGIPEMVSVTAGTLHDRFLIDEADVTDFSAYVCGNGSSPREYGVFNAKDEDAATRISDALKAHVEMQRKTFSTYKPDEMYKFDDSFVDINGTVVSYAVCEDNDRAKALLG